jgi:hypothetical protein
MIGNYKRAANKGSLAVMFTVLTLLFVYLANVLPVLRITMYFVASAFILGILMERMTFAAFLSFIIVLFVGFVIVPVKVGMLPYLFFFGHYGIFKYFVDGNREGAGALVMKLVYFNIGFALMYFFTDGWMTELFPFQLPWWALLIAGEIVFLVYDWLVTKAAQGYYATLRNRLALSDRF